MATKDPGAGRSRLDPTPRTAVVIVHGMGEQLPKETLNRFVRSALPKAGGERKYYSRPERVTDSFEARRHLAPRIPTKGFPEVHGQTEFFEYHWSYKMQGNKLGDVVPTMLRLVLRRSGTVPFGLRFAWLVSWVLIAAFVASVALVVVHGFGPGGWVTPRIVVLVAGNAVVAAALLSLLKGIGSSVTKSFVDVVRYLDRSPRSYAVRREIRAGMVDLLEGLHESGRYARVVVVAHSLGAFIAYDAITSVWGSTCNLHAGPVKRTGTGTPLPGLLEVERLAAKVDAHPRAHTALSDGQRKELADYRAAQFALWQATRLQGNPWLVTDFISVGTPMYFADLLFTTRRSELEQLTRITELPTCPPRSGSQTVEGKPTRVGSYGFNNQGREVLVQGAPFAVVRWTNLYFPVERFWLGDWFGGPLRPLFGAGIVDEPVLGNLRGRLAPAIAHGRYFSYPDALGPDDLASVLQRHLSLTIDEDLEALRDAPPYLEETDRRGTRTTTASRLGAMPPS